MVLALAEVRDFFSTWEKCFSIHAAGKTHHRVVPCSFNVIHAPPQHYPS
jgi:hypothetical protein